MFITFEGIDFCGKSTQVALLENFLLENGKKVKIIREPGGTQISEKIRDILLDKKNYHMVIESELLLFSASRAQLVREVIQPSLNEGYYVISDRFHDSTTAYQGYGRQIPMDFIQTINRFAIGATLPQITFFLDIPVEEAENRRHSRGNGELDRIEASRQGFYERVRQGYRCLSSLEPRFKTIDGLKSVEEIHVEIISELSKLGLIA